MEKWERVVQGLLTKAQADGTTEHERDALIEKATYLMAKFGIEEATAREKTTGEEVVYLEVVITSPYKTSKAELLRIVAQVLGGKTVNLYGGRAKQIFAYKGDLERIKMLYSSLMAQMIFGLAEAKLHKPAWENGKAFANSWLFGFVFRVGQRLHEAKRRAEQEYNNLPVLRNRDDQVMSAMIEQYPDLSASKPINIRLSSRDGYERGMAAGNRADIGGKKVSSPVPRRGIND